MRRPKKLLLPLGVAIAPSIASGGVVALAGFHWEFVTSNGERVTNNGQPAEALVRN